MSQYSSSNKKYSGQVSFSIADLGIGIRRNVKENTRLGLAPEDAIIWATKGRNTTKRGQILKLLSEFIDLNGGRIQIVKVKPLPPG